MKGNTVNSEAERQSWIQGLARRIAALGFSPVALALIEATHPLTFLGSQMLLVAQPVLTGLVSDATMERALALLDDPELLDHLETCLERGGSA